MYFTLSPVSSQVLETDRTFRAFHNRQQEPLRPAGFALEISQSIGTVTADE
jgi:hypothetical protein